MDKLHRSEGDINISPRRTEWQKRNLDSQTRALLEEDERYFLKQSLSTPCLNAMRACEGVYIEDLQGRRYMDFHGNNDESNGWQCCNDQTGCMYNDGHNTCCHHGLSRKPLEETEITC